MKILISTPYLHPEGGGLERYADAMAHQWTASGHDVTQLGFAHHERYEYERGFRRIGVAYAARVSNTPVGLDLHRKARELLRRETFDLVNGHAPVPGAAEAAYYAARRARVPFVATYHAGRLAGGSFALDLIAAAHRGTLERSMLTGAAGRIAVSEYVRSRALEGLTSEVIPPGVDIAWLREIAPRVRGRILFVGPVSRAYAWKGFRVLFSAFERIASERPLFHLRVVGGGDLVEHYRARATRLGIARRVTFMDRVSDEMMPREYSRAEVVVLPSVSDAESFGMVLAEANACSRPVVASRIGGVPDFVQHGVNGLLVEPGDPEGLARALLRVLDEPDLAHDLGAAGRELVSREHQWVDLAKRAETLFADWVRHPRRRAQPRTAKARA